MINLKAQRKSRHMTTRQFHEAAGIRLIRYMMIEQCDIEPTPQEITAIQKVLDTNPILDNQSNKRVS